MPPQHYSQSNYMYINNTHGMRNDRLHVSTRLKGNYLPVGFSYSPCLVAILKALTFHSQTCRKMSKEADFINTLLLFIFFVCFFFFFFHFLVTNTKKKFPELQSSTLHYESLRRENEGLDTR